MSEDRPADTEPGTGAVLGLSRANVRELLTVLVRPGADLYGGLVEGLRQAGAQRATVVSGIGALGRTTARNLRALPETFPITDDDRLFPTVPGPCELVALTGWAAPFASGRDHLHLHFVASYVDGERVELIGGHLSPGAVEASIHVAVTFAVHDRVDARYLYDPSIGVERLSAEGEQGADARATLAPVQDERNGGERRR